MGTNKALLKYNGISLGEFALRKLGEACGENAELLISGSVPGLTQTCISDEKPGLGPIGGLFSVWKFLRKKHENSLNGAEVLVLPVDMPAVSSDDLSRLLEGLKAADSVTFKGHSLPLAFRITERFTEYCEKQVPILSERQRSLQALSRYLRGVELPYGKDASMLSNLNTPEEWRKFLAAH